jgi:ankyrin repeat protein
MTAIHNNHDDLVDLLLSRGANVDHRDSAGFTPLLEAVVSQNDHAVRQILATGKTLLSTPDSRGMTPLISATSSGNIALVRMLLDGGADVSQTDPAGKTALFHSSAPDILLLLVNRGAKLDHLDKRGRSVLHCASEQGNIDIAKTCVELGFVLDQQDSNGHKPYDLAKTRAMKSLLSSCSTRSDEPEKKRKKKS